MKLLLVFLTTRKGSYLKRKTIKGFSLILATAEINFMAIFSAIILGKYLNSIIFVLQVSILSGKYSVF